MKKEIKITKLVFIALGMAFAINLSEVLYFFDSPFTFFINDRETTLQLIFYRIICYSILCFSTLYISLYLTDKWLLRFTYNLRIIVHPLVHITFYFLTFIPFIEVHKALIMNLSLTEQKGLSFVWFILILICVLAASLLKLRATIKQQLTNESPFVRFNNNKGSFSHELEFLEKNYLTSLLLPRKKVLEPVNVKDFALFFIDDGIVKGKTFDSKIYFLDRSIQELEENLKPAIFFRANRQSIVNRNAVKHLEPDSYGKMALALQVEHADLVISKLKINDFKDWLVEFSG